MAEASKSWFAVFNNPSNHGYEGTPQEVCERLRDEWIKGSETRSGAWAYCISKDGLHHIHMVLEDTKTMRFSTIKKSYCQGMHFEATKGTKKQAQDYIEKNGEFEEKGETIECIIYHGEIRGRQGRRKNTFDGYFLRLQEGETPKDILADTPSAYKNISAIRQMYYDIRSSQTDWVRDVKVYWHTGETGSGKSYSRNEVIKKYGENKIYYLTAYNSGAFDNYNGEPILWIEDYRSEFKFQELLRILDVYKAEIPSRYSNVKALWTEVHITSILTPRQCYPDIARDNSDRIEQLLRRITNIVYHFKTKQGDYLSFYADPFKTTLNEMIDEATKRKDFIDSFETILEVDE